MASDLTNRIQQIIQTTKQQKAEEARLAKEKELKKQRARREHALKNLQQGEVFDAEELDAAYLEGLKKAPEEVVKVEDDGKKIRLKIKDSNSKNKHVLEERLHKVIARCGIASVRKAEALIEEGRVSVDGKLASIGQQVNVLDRGLKIRVDGQIIPHLKAVQQPCRVLIYNKDEGEFSTRVDTEGRKTVFDRLPRLEIGRWIQVGRLDANTTGLLLFTNDGELANRLMHPSYQIERTYLCRVYGEVTDAVIARLKKGVMLEDGLAKFNSIKALSNQEENSTQHSNSWFEVTLSEGRNHEVRRLWESQNLVVSRLKRVSYAGISLNRELLIPASGYLEADLNEINLLRGQVGLKPEHRGFRPGNYGQSNSELKRQKNKQFNTIRGAIRKDSLYRSDKKVFDERNKDKRERRQQLVSSISSRNKEKFSANKAYTNNNSYNDSYNDSDNLFSVFTVESNFNSRGKGRNDRSNDRSNDRNNDRNRGGKSFAAKGRNERNARGDRNDRNSRGDRNSSPRNGRSSAYGSGSGSFNRNDRNGNDRYSNERGGRNSNGRAGFRGNSNGGQGRSGNRGSAGNGRVQSGRGKR